VTREVVGTEAVGPPAPTPAPVFDLGELVHGPAPRSRPPAEPIGLRMRRVRPPSPRVVAVVLVAGLLALAAGWHLGTGRARSEQAALTQAHPPALAWLTFLGGSDAQPTPTPHTVLDLNIMNLGQTDLRVTSITSHTEVGTATARLRPNATVVAAPGETAHRIIDLDGSCATTYAGASLDVNVAIGRAGGPITPARVTAVDDSSIGVPYAAILNLFCQDSAPVEGGLGGIFVQQTSSATSARLVLTNRSGHDKQIDITTGEEDGFDLVAFPRAPFVLGPGRSQSVLLRIGVSSCKDVGRLSNWADAVSLRITSRIQTGADAADDTGPSQLGLRDVLLAPGGAAVQKACG
jgi:hypothetical protein